MCQNDVIYRTTQYKELIWLIGCKRHASGDSKVTDNFICLVRKPGSIIVGGGRAVFPPSFPPSIPLNLSWCFKYCCKMIRNSDLSQSEGACGSFPSSNPLNVSCCFKYCRIIRWWLCTWTRNFGIVS